MKTCSVNRLVFTVLAAVYGIFHGVPAGAAPETRATIVWYMEQEAGVEPYRVRYIVTPEFMRSDEGRDDGAYTLLDRRHSQIYSVVPENHTVLQVDGTGDSPAVSAAPVPDFKVQTTVDEQSPRVGGEAPLRVDLISGATVCRSALVAAGMLKPVQQAMQDFQRVLAVQQARTLENTPGEYRTPCFLLRYLYAGDFHWSRGLVLAGWNAQGERRELIDYQTDVMVPKSLFEVPGDYRLLPAAAGR